MIVPPTMTIKVKATIPHSDTAGIDGWHATGRLSQVEFSP
jgi:hypothetical protein